jgi:hypothetical protein
VSDAGALATDHRHARELSTETQHNTYTIYKTNTRWEHNANRCVDFALRRHQKELNEKKLVRLEAMLHLKESELQVLCSHAHANISRT